MTDIDQEQQTKIKQTTLTKEQYQTLYKRSIADPQHFWGEQAERFVSWFKRWDVVRQGDFEKLNVRWFMGGQLNVCYNCLDRHLETRKNQTAIFWEGDDPTEHRTITYQDLYEEVCRFANVLKKQGIKKGDRICIYLSMIPEAVVAMLACARIGAIHSVIFGGFSSESLRMRILDADCRLIITADEGIRGGKKIPLKANVDKALIGCPAVKKVIVVKRTGNEVEWKKDRDIWYHEAIQNEKPNCPAQMMDSEDPLFILYTSGSTGKPKGVLHTSANYLVYSAMTFKYVFNYEEGDIFWCTADVGWITGHSYSVYGPLANGATTVMFEGVPQYPNYSRYWEIIDKYQVNIFYTSPTAIRAIRKQGDQWVKSANRRSLKLLGTVGEPINPEVWQWYYKVVGEKRCPIVDTWWQTETGGIMIVPLPGVAPLKAGSAGWPFFGVIPEIIDDKGQPAAPGKIGKLILTQPWPGLMETIYHDKQRFADNYFKEFPGRYLTGDSAYRDEEGYYFIVGRDDDVIKVSGHRIGTEEVESVLVTHPDISEAAVVAIQHEIKGEAIYAYVTTKVGIKPTEKLKAELTQYLRNGIGAIAVPECIQWAESLPKTRSGKIMRRILRKIANGETQDLGDTSTLVDPEVIEDLISERNRS